MKCVKEGATRMPFCGRAAPADDVLNTTIVAVVAYGKWWIRNDMSFFASPTVYEYERTSYTDLSDLHLRSYPGVTIMAPLPFAILPAISTVVVYSPSKCSGFFSRSQRPRDIRNIRCHAAPDVVAMH